MKTFWFAAMLVAVGAPAMAQSWSPGSPQLGTHRSNQPRVGPHADYGRTPHSNGPVRTGYDFRFNGGTGDGHGHSTPNSWSQRAGTPSVRTRGIYDPLHGDFHPTVRSGYPSSLNQPGINHRRPSYDDQLRY